MQLNVTAITGLDALDHLVAERPSPDNLITPNPVVRPAGKCPVANGGGQGYFPALSHDLPARRFERGYHFLPTATAAFVQRSAVLLADVQHSVNQLIWDDLDELWSDTGLLHSVTPNSERASDWSATVKV
ncbi:hypothetical protein D9M68_926760 [compost metagenome]